MLCIYGRSKTDCDAGGRLDQPGPWPRTAVLAYWVTAVRPMAARRSCRRCRLAELLYHTRGLFDDLKIPIILRLELSAMHAIMMDRAVPDGRLS